MHIQSSISRALAAASLALACGLVAGPASASAQQPHQELRAEAGRALGFDLPDAFVPPPLHPRDAVLRTVQVGPGTYALISSRPPVDNAGFVVGEKGVLVVDAHINEAMAGRIQQAVREVTDKPILYLVNTNHHGDHTFGNHAFPASTQIIAHRETARAMQDFEAERRFLLVTVDADRSVYGDATLRLPDITFDRSLRVDLGGRVVEVHHFGQGNTAGDAVVFVPDAGVAWTGNFVLGKGIVPFLLIGDPAAYAASLGAFSEAVRPRIIVPGHGPPTDAEGIRWNRAYLEWLQETATEARKKGWSADEAFTQAPLPERFLPASESPVDPGFVRGLHAFNLAAALAGAPERPAP